MVKKVVDINELGWPFLRINSNGAKEYACPHGVGHGGIHGCDGCCRQLPFQAEWDEDGEQE